MQTSPPGLRSRLLGPDHAMLLVLLLLAVLLSVATYGEQQPNGTAAAEQLSSRLKGARVLIVVRDGAAEEAYAAQMERKFTEQGIHVVGVIKAQPPAARQRIAELTRKGEVFDAYVVNRPGSAWTIYERLAEDFPSLKNAKVHVPESYFWPSFLTASNLLNVANQIAVIAIMAIGMTMVVIVGGIDLSVGSLLALSAVITTLVIRDVAGAEESGSMALLLAGLAGMLACGLVGLISGMMVTLFRMPAFIVTLAVMLMASGLAFVLSAGQSIHQVPEAFTWLGRSADLLGIPNAVVLMILLYFLAHFVMTRTVLGRYFYAVGGNARAARYSGVPVNGVRTTAFVISGLLAGLGGVILASQFRSGSPNYGQMYELSVIAAVVVGGASLSGGRGRVFGTLTGAFIIGVIHNGMNLMGMRSEIQRVVLGGVILAAVLLDRIGKAEDV